MAIENEVQYRIRYVCDGCGAEEFYSTSWAAPGGGTVHMPTGWAHLYAISVLQINDVARTTQGLDFCGACLDSRNLRFMIEKIPFDERSLKTSIPIANDRAAPSRGSKD